MADTTAKGLVSSTSLSTTDQAKIINALKTASRVSVSPLFHRILMTTFATLNEIQFFANKPPTGALAWWLANFKLDYLREATNIFGYRFYFVGDYAVATNGAGIVCTTVATFAIATNLIATWNAVNNGLARVKVNDTDHQWQDVCKMLAPLKYTEWGFDDGAGNASYGTFPQADSAAGYFIFKRADRTIDPIKLAKNDEFSVTLRTPTALGAAGTMPANFYLTCELMTELSSSLYAG